MCVPEFETKQGNNNLIILHETERIREHHKLLLWFHSSLIVTTACVIIVAYVPGLGTIMSLWNQITTLIDPINSISHAFFYLFTLLVAWNVSQQNSRLERWVVKLVRIENENKQSEKNLKLNGRRKLWMKAIVLPQIIVISLFFFVPFTQ